MGEIFYSIFIGSFITATGILLTYKISTEEKNIFSNKKKES